VTDRGKTPAAPRGLDVAGRRLWRAVADGYDLGPDELQRLREAAFVADELERLRAALRDAPSLITIGSQGQPKPHPLLAQARAHRVVLDRLLTGLNLPDEGEAVGLMPAQRRAQRAATARWEAAREAKAERERRLHRM
jgi:hypothetical protein